MARPKYSDDRKVSEGKLLKKYFSQTKLSEKSLTQRKLSRELGITPAVICQWFGGVTRVPDSHWLYLSRRFKFDPLECRPELATAYVRTSSLEMARRIEGLSAGQRAFVELIIDAVAQLDVKLN